MSAGGAFTMPGLLEEAKRERKYCPERWAVEVTDGDDEFASSALRHYAPSEVGKDLACFADRRYKVLGICPHRGRRP